MESELNTCIICSVKHGRMIDGPTCELHSVDSQDKFRVDRKVWLRMRELGAREKYNSEKNMQFVRGWAAGLEKRTEVR